MSGFKIPTKKNPSLVTPKREHQGDILGKKKQLPRKKEVEEIKKISKPTRKTERKTYNKLSILLNDEQYNKIATMADAEDRSMNKIIMRHLIETGFIQ